MRDISFLLRTVGNTPISQAGFLLADATNFSFETFTPGGVFGAGRITVPLTGSIQHDFTAGRRLQAYVGSNAIYDGYIDGVTWRDNSADLTLSGPWGFLLNRRIIRRRWADARMDAQTWRYDSGTYTANAYDKATPDWYNRLAIIPKAVSWANNDNAYFYYTMPNGEKIKRITFDYDFDEGAQQWRAAVFSSDDMSAFGSEDTITATGTGSKDLTLATARRYVILQFANVSGGALTPVSDGDVRMVWTNIKVYSSLDSTATAGTLNMNVLLGDLAANYTSVQLLALAPFYTSNTYNLAPAVDAGPPIVPGGGFIAEGDAETWASVLLRAASFGDSSQNEWRVGLGLPQSTNNPPLISTAYPALTDYDYTVNRDQVTGGLRQAYDEIYNYIVVQYRDEEGNQLQSTPVDDAGLTDATSVANYSRRDYVLSIPGTSNSTLAIQLGKRFLAARKNPRIYLDSPIQVTGKILGKTTGWTSVYNVQAASRIRITNWLDDLAGTGLTLRINRTRYDHDRDTLSIWAGQPDPLVTLLSRLQAGR